MRSSFVILNLVAIVLLVSSQSVLAQFGDCPTLPDATTLESLIRDTFAGGSNPTNPRPPNVVVRDFNYVCLVSGMFRDTYRKLSVVVSYACSGSACPSALPLSQFDFTCNSEGAWEGEVSDIDFSRRDVADADLITPNRTNCSFCVAPNHSLVVNISLPYDMTTHCIACNAQCNHGDMRCFGPDPDECCSFYDPHDNSKCLNECPPETMVTDNFDCAAYLRFSQSVYTFTEEDGAGSIMVKGTPGLTANVMGESLSYDPHVSGKSTSTSRMTRTIGEIGFAVPSYTFIENEGMGIVTVNGPVNFPSNLSVQISGGPGAQPSTVRTSGTDVNLVLTSFPVEISFPIVDDDGAIETVERYSLSLIPSDPSITLNQATSQIVILDDDEIIIGFPHEELTLEASDVDDAIVLLFGEALQSFEIEYIQEYVTIVVSFAPGDWTGADVDVSIHSIPHTYFYVIAIKAVTDGVTVGGTVNTLNGRQQVFSMVNIIIVRYDVGFVVTSYTFNESEGIGRVTVMGPENFPHTLSVLILGGPGAQPSTVRTSGTSVNEELTSFPAEISFPIIDDDVALETVERYSLSLIPSDPLVIINQATSEIVILENDELIVGFPYDVMTFEASAVGNVIMILFGEARQGFVVNFIQENSTTLLTFEAGNYPIGFEKELPLTFPIVSAPQGYTFKVVLDPVTKGVTAGGMINILDKHQQVFQDVTITIIDNDQEGGSRSTPYISIAIPAVIVIIIIIATMMTIVIWKIRRQREDASYETPDRIYDVVDDANNSGPQRDRQSELRQNMEVSHTLHVELSPTALCQQMSTDGLLNDIQHSDMQSHGHSVSGQCHTTEEHSSEVTTL